MLIRATLYRQGYAGSGQGAREAEIAYLRVLRFSEAELQFLDQLRYLRNGILYYGKTVDAEYAQKVIAFTRRLQVRLRRVVVR